MKRNSPASTRLILTTATALFIAPAYAAPVYWDGNAAANWDTLAEWSTDATATTPDPVTIPGATDDAVFNINGVNGAQTVSLNGVRSINSLSFYNTGTTTISGAATSPTPGLTLGAGGIFVDAAAGASSINITGSSVTFGSLHLSASQTWTNNSATPFNIANTFSSAAGVNVSIANGTFAMTPVLTGSLTLTSVAGTLDIAATGKFRISSDIMIGGLSGAVGATFENGGTADKWMRVNTPVGVDTTYSGSIVSGAAVPRLGFVKQGLGTQTLAGSNTMERLAAENGLLKITGTTAVGAGTATGVPSANRTFLAGNVANQNGRALIDGGTVTADRNNGGGVLIGTTANGQGFVKMTSGSLTTTNHEMRVGNGAGSYGAYTQDGGTLTTARWLGVGFANDRAVLNLNGGTINAGATSDFVTIAAGAPTSVGTLNVTGGTLNAIATLNGGIVVAERGVGTLNVSGGTVNAATNGLSVGPLAAQTGWNGQVNLNGGTVNTNLVRKGLGTGVAILGFNGGTLAATGPNATFLQGLDQANVYSGGGTIENNGHNITIGQNLTAPAGNGVSTAGLTVTGSGFFDTPLVAITGGGGTGAKAVATVDALGNLTGITMTSPGTGYTSAPTFTLLTTLAGVNIGGGVGSTASITGTATLVANTAGSLTFSGSGTTRLSGANTFGTANLTAGNLQVDGSLAGGVSMVTTSTLSGVGTIAGAISSTGGTVSPGANGGADVGTLNTAAVSLDSSSALSLTINEEITGGLDVINNSGMFSPGGASLNITFNDTTYTVGTTAGDLASATRYTFVLGAVDSTFFGNTTLIPAGDLATLGLAAGQREITAGGQRFWLEKGSWALVPIAPVIPEPSSLVLLLAGLTGLLARRKRQ